ncbi:MAG: SAM-dependent methyltransferase [Actinomycetes bacterium]
MTDSPRERWLTWRVATEQALYGDGGFYRRTAGPAAHFRTSAHSAGGYAEALLTLARSADLRTVVDIGSGLGELLRALNSLDPSLQLVGVELADRPDDLPDQIAWTATVPTDVEGLVVANEWLDNVPVDVARRESGGVHLLLVDPVTGAEQVGPLARGRDEEWLGSWWPLDVGERAEIGHPRDDAWATAVNALRRGIALAADYEHGADDRPVGGSLAGYADGRQVPPVPDGSCDITSHVALDACAEAGDRAGAAWTVHTTQRQALRALGAGRPMPPHDLAARDPAAYLSSLARASEDSELTRRGGLGDFGWLVQGVDAAVPEVLSALAARP